MIELQKEPQKIWVIIKDDGGIYCAVNSMELAENIIAEDTRTGDLELGAFATKVKLFYE